VSLDELGIGDISTSPKPIVCDSLSEHHDLIISIINIDSGSISRLEYNLFFQCLSRDMLNIVGRASTRHSAIS
jgi:hypothetical protein